MAVKEVTVVEPGAFHADGFQWFTNRRVVSNRRRGNREIPEPIFYRSIHRAESRVAS